MEKMALKIGDTAPGFFLPDQDGKTQNLSDFLGKWVLLYFYPQDDTPGCTTEACLFRDNLPSFKNLGAEVLGVSVDSVASHQKFVAKYGLPFTLLADENRTVVNLYGVWGQKTFAGKNYNGTRRSSFLIDPEGKIAKIYEDADPKNHSVQVLEDLGKLKAS